jgi:hypothetical protein
MLARTAIEIKGAIYTKIDEYSNVRRYYFSEYEMSSWVKVQDHIIAIPAQASEDDMVAGEVAVLRQAIDTVKQRTFEAVQELEDRIQKLSAIGYHPTPAGESQL